MRFDPSGAVSPINDMAALELHPNANKVTINRHKNKNDPWNKFLLSISIDNTKQLSIYCSIFYTVLKMWSVYDENKSELKSAISSK